MLRAHHQVYFYWICPGFDAWSWFAALLMDIEEKLAEIGKEDFLEIRVYMTRGWTSDDANRLMLQDREDGMVRACADPVLYVYVVCRTSTALQRKPLNP